VNLYLDTSALVKFYVTEEGSESVRDVTGRARLVSTSVIAYVEARAAFARRRREGGLRVSDYRRVIRDLDADWPHYVRLEASESLVRDAARIAEVHGLRAYDTIHLASALVLKRRLIAPVVFGCWDTELKSAAPKVGLQIFPD